MAKLGFLGLGIMGGPMAQRHLLMAGHRVALWSHSPYKASAMARHGNGIVCATPAEVGTLSGASFSASATLRCRVRSLLVERVS
jgi:3-hydroxyisobutyrate dehydrogenase/2-hydroxy-3-oxopropionate reductase